MVSAFVSRLKENWKSGLTVSLVSIPLSISLAVASGTTPLAGILTAIWAGLIASFFAGSNFNIVGPTGALSGIIAVYALAHGSSSLGLLAVMAGAIILVAYFFKLERYLIYIPSSVIHGFTLGVAFVIGLGQLNYALGLYGLPKHEKLALNIWESLQHIGSASVPTILMFLLFLAGLFIVRRFLPKIPGAILLSPLGIIVGYLEKNGTLHFGFKTLGDLFGTLPVHLLVFPKIEFTPALLSAGITVALIAILETMLSARIADGMTKTKHRERKEMLALGLANIGSGFLGGIPATAALARTALNIKTGATHKTSATINALSVAVISLVLFSYFAYIPMAVIAAILIYTAINMVETGHFIRFFKFDKADFCISLLVASITFYADPILGIVTGAALSLLVFAEKTSHGYFELSIKQGADTIIKTSVLPEEQEKNQDVLVYSFKGNLAYLTCRAHVVRFEQSLKKYRTIILRFREVGFIDLDGVEAVEEILAIMQERGQEVLIASLHGEPEEMLLEHAPTVRTLRDEGCVFTKTELAVEYYSSKQK